MVADETPIIPVNKALTPGQIIAKYQANAPVDVVSISSELGIKVWEMPDLPSGISGQIWKDPINGGASGYSIGVRASEPVYRKRFTVAHEIAHFILHRDKLDGGLYEDVMYRGGLSSKEEIQANQMAADILMPFPLIKKLIDEGQDSLEKLADSLQVSLPALKIRLGITQ
jgi:hypothetical protein